MPGQDVIASILTSFWCFGMLGDKAIEEEEFDVSFMKALVIDVFKLSLGGSIRISYYEHTSLVYV